MKNIFAFIALLCVGAFATPVPVSQTVHDTAGVLRSNITDSTAAARNAAKTTAHDTATKVSHDTAGVLRTRIADTASALRAASKQTAQDTATKVAHDTAQVLRSQGTQTAQDTAKKVVHDTMLVRIPQAIATNSSVQFSKVQFGSGSTSLAYSDSGSFLDTITGMTTTVTATCKWIRLGNMAWIYVPAQTGTSNATSCTIKTLPSQIRPATQQEVFLGDMEDNGIVYSSGLLQISTAGVMTLFVNPSAILGPTSTTTAAGVKGWTRPLTFSFLVAP